MDIEARLRASTFALPDILAEVTAENVHIFLLIDQFEEIFRFYKNTDSEDAHAFVALLLHSVKYLEATDNPSAQQNQFTNRLHIALTMRSDFLGDCNLFYGLPEAINSNQYLVPRLTEKELSDAIIGPARMFGFSVDPYLVSNLVNEAAPAIDDRGHPKTDQLPLLQHALMRLWTETSKISETGEPQLNLVNFNKFLGSVGNALNDHIEKVYDSLRPNSNILLDEQYIAQIMFRTLSERGTDKLDIRRPATIKEIAEIALPQISDEKKKAEYLVDAIKTIQHVTECFRLNGRNFIVTTSKELNENTQLDIAHESLLRQWLLLSKWMDIETRSAAELRRTVDAAILWQEKSGSLWTNVELRRNEHWKKKLNPNEKWAERYISLADYQLAERFIEESKKKASQLVNYEPLSGGVIANYFKSNQIKFPKNIRK